MHRLPEDSPAKTAYKEVTEKPVRKTKGGQRLTWHQTIIRDLKTIDTDFKKSYQIVKGQRPIQRNGGGPRNGQGSRQFFS